MGTTKLMVLVPINVSKPLANMNGEVKDCMCWVDEWRHSTITSPAC